MSTSSVGWVIVPDSVTFVEATSASGVPVSTIYLLLYTWVDVISPINTHYIVNMLTNSKHTTKY